MRRKLWSVSVLAALVAVTLLAATPAPAKDYYFPSVEIDVTVRSDGSF